MAQPKQYQMYIDGEFTQGHSPEWIEVENPADETVVAMVPEGTVEDAHRALEAARAAQPAWAAMPAIERGTLVRKLAEAVLAETDYLAGIVVREQGKPLDQARGEIAATAMFLEYAGQQARRIQGELLPSDHRNEDV